MPEDGRRPPPSENTSNRPVEFSGANRHSELEKEISCRSDFMRLGSQS
jgi:hypothetical protein